MTEANATQELAARLRDGCVLTGHEDRSYELVDEVATNALMRSAADLIEAQSAEIAQIKEELRIARGDAARANERAQRAEARNTILRGKDAYDLPAVLDRANRLQAEVDELRFERDPRNSTIVTKRLRAKAAEANKAREKAEARATKAEAAMTAERDAAKADVDLLDRVIAAFADDLGVEPDNEAIHEAIQAIRDERDAAVAQVKALREALEDIQCVAAAAIGPNCGAGPDLIRISARAHDAFAASAPADGLVRELANADAVVG